jgi:hypothetical protein
LKIESESGADEADRKALKLLIEKITEKPHLDQKKREPLGKNVMIKQLEVAKVKAKEIYSRHNDLGEARVKLCGLDSTLSCFKCKMIESDVSKFQECANSINCFALICYFCK